MRRFHWVRLYALLLMILLFATTVFAAVRGLLYIYEESSRQNRIIRSVQALNNASDRIMRGITDIAREAGQQQYDQLVELATVEDDSRLSESDLEYYFRRGYVNKVKDALGDGPQICDKLDSFLGEDGAKQVSVINSEDTVLEEEKDDDGNTISLRIKNVMIACDNPEAGGRSETISYSIQFPDAVFHAGNDELFKYCLIAGKGLYITGRTSSFIGDIYAGDHTPEEVREAEIEYGETGTYGGINILSTQLGIRSDRIISRGDININGSFVVFDANSESLDCYAQRVNEMQGFSKKAQYTLEGTFHQIQAMREDELTGYLDAVRSVETALSDLKEIPIYYDSENDVGYAGRYRKLVSDKDIEIRNDFTGIVATPANVIIHKDVNFEGILLCGNRVYMMGNNNIVANPVVARSVIASEIKGDYGFRIMDYIGGMKKPGLFDPEYYVVPYNCVSTNQLY